MTSPTAMASRNSWTLIWRDSLINGVPGELELTTCNFLANVIDDCHGLILYLNLTSPTHCFRGVLHCATPNAGHELLPEAGAQRTVGSGGGVTIPSSPQSGTCELPRMPLKPIARP